MYKLLNYVWSSVMFIKQFTHSWVLFVLLDKSFALFVRLASALTSHSLFVYLGSVKPCPSRQWGDCLVKVIKVPLFNALVCVRSFLNAQLSKQENTNKLTVSVSMVTNINTCCRIQWKLFYLFKLWVRPRHNAFIHTQVSKI